MIKASLAAALCLFSLAVRAEVLNIDNAELERLTATGVPLIDIRTEAEWNATGVIAGSKQLTFVDGQGNAVPGWLEKTKAVAKPDQPVILICRSGNRTKAASQLLAQQAGYTTVYTVSKGLNGWIGEGKPLVPAAVAK